MSFEKVLVANRGEIACRVLQSARSLGYRTVAVFSEPDAGARHVQLADEAVCIGPATAAESYLNVAALLDACRRSGADAVHPGYGFLSENADFAAACAEAGVTFIGPPAEAIRLMGSKRLSKIAMQEAGVPCVPGYQGEDQSDDTLIKEAEAVGLPLMIKASAGGGGRGMRVVTEPEQIAAQLKSARQEAKSSFGNDELILERAVINPATWRSRCSATTTATLSTWASATVRCSAAIRRWWRKRPPRWSTRTCAGAWARRR